MSLRQTSLCDNVDDIGVTCHPDVDDMSPLDLTTLSDSVYRCAQTRLRTALYKLVSAAVHGASEHLFTRVKTGCSDCLRCVTRVRCHGERCHPDVTSMLHVTRKCDTVRVTPVTPQNRPFRPQCCTVLEMALF